MSSPCLSLTQNLTNAHFTRRCIMLLCTSRPPMYPVLFYTFPNPVPFFLLVDNSNLHRFCNIIWLPHSVLPSHNFSAMYPCAHRPRIYVRLATYIPSGRDHKSSILWPCTQIHSFGRLLICTYPCTVFFKFSIFKDLHVVIWLSLEEIKNWF